MKWVCAKCNPSCHLSVSEDVIPTDCPYRQSLVNSNQDATANWQKEKSSGKKAAKKVAVKSVKRTPLQSGNGISIAGIRLL
jgi:hypothetical protein